MAEQPFTLEKVYNIVRDRLGVLHQGNMNYQEATFMADAKAVGKHIQSLLVTAGDRYYDDLTSATTVTADSESTNLFPSNREEVCEIRRIWLLNDDETLLTPLHNRSIDRTDIYTGSNPTYEVINNTMYWFPPPDSDMKVKVEYIRHYDADLSGSSDMTDETGDEVDIPEYAQDYFLNELTARAGVALKQNVGQWMTLAMRSRETMVLTAARNVPRRKWVHMGGR